LLERLMVEDRKEIRLSPRACAPALSPIWTWSA
jgi:hypothetical protein